MTGSNLAELKTPIERAIAIVGGQTELADKINRTQGQVSSWVVGRRPVPPKHCIPIEAITKGAVTRFELRPDIFGEPGSAVA